MRVYLAIRYPANTRRRIQYVCKEKQTPQTDRAFFHLAVILRHGELVSTVQQFRPVVTVYTGPGVVQMLEIFLRHFGRRRAQDAREPSTAVDEFHVRIHVRLTPHAPDRAQGARVDERRRLLLGGYGREWRDDQAERYIRLKRNVPVKYSRKTHSLVVFERASARSPVSSYLRSTERCRWLSG